VWTAEPWLVQVTVPPGAMVMGSGTKPASVTLTVMFWGSASARVSGAGTSIKADRLNAISVDSHRSTDIEAEYGARALLFGLLMDEFGRPTVGIATLGCKVN